jgi:fatty acid/phospholipid biosynthesis enzyme
VALICHGGSSATAIKNAVYVADRFAQSHLGQELTTAVAHHSFLWEAPATPSTSTSAGAVS